jgi:hypothetical protein
MDFRMNRLACIEIQTARLVEDTPDFAKHSLTEDTPGRRFTS